jgi:cytochrome c551/c552
MKKTAPWVLLGLLAIGIVAGALVLSGASAADSAWLPGLLQVDSYPKGCVDCHKVDAGKDYRITAYLPQNHPDVSKLKTIPGDCASCHKRGGAGPELPALMHQNHYRNTDKNGFVLYYKGACLNCHAVDVKTGVVSVKSGPKNW